jgi:hypothetical protein
MRCIRYASLVKTPDNRVCDKQDAQGAQQAMREVTLVKQECDWGQCPDGTMPEFQASNPAETPSPVE